VLPGSRLARRGIFWAGCETLLEPTDLSLDWDTLIASAEAYPGLTFLSSEIAWTAGHFSTVPFTRLSFPIQDYTKRSEIWKNALQSKNFEDIINKADLVDDIARAFQLTEGQIYDAVITAKAKPGAGTQKTQSCAAKMCMRLPAAVRAQVDQFCAADGAPSGLTLKN